MSTRSQLFSAGSAAAIALAGAPLLGISRGGRGPAVQPTPRPTPMRTLEPWRHRLAASMPNGKAVAFYNDDSGGIHSGTDNNNNLVYSGQASAEISAGKLLIQSSIVFPLISPNPIKTNGAIPVGINGGTIYYYVNGALVTVNGSTGALTTKVTDPKGVTWTVTMTPDSLGQNFVLQVHGSNGYLYTNTIALAQPMGQGIVNQRQSPCSLAAGLAAGFFGAGGIIGFAAAMSFFGGPEMLPIMGVLTAIAAGCAMIGGVIALGAWFACS